MRDEMPRSTIRSRCFEKPGLNLLPSLSMRLRLLMLSLSKRRRLGDGIATSALLLFRGRCGQRSFTYTTIGILAMLLLCFPSLPLLNCPTCPLLAVSGLSRLSDLSRLKQSGWCCRPMSQESMKLPPLSS